jgi:hypothetical protein
MILFLISTDSAHNAARRGGESGIQVNARSRAGRCALIANFLNQKHPAFRDFHHWSDLRAVLFEHRVQRGSDLRHVP